MNKKIIRSIIMTGALIFSQVTIAEQKKSNADALVVLGILSALVVGVAVFGGDSSSSEDDEESRKQENNEKWVEYRTWAEANGQ